MGRPKLMLPWGNTSVIGRVLQVLQAGGVDDILVVTGGSRQEVEKVIAGFPVRTRYNPDYAESEMVKSLQLGISALGDEIGAALVVLGDQPQVQPEVIGGLLEAFREHGDALIVPSYQMQRGHPWLLGRTLWREVLSLPPSDTLRDFIERHAQDIHYLTVDTASVLQDLDTPEDYQQYRPEH
jgi:molybdenum cofactor cytidylyltransferase